MFIRPNGKLGKLIAAAALFVFAMGPLSCAADTPIPSGYAEYEITIPLTGGFPELTSWGNWPVQMALKLTGPKATADFRGNLVSHLDNANGVPTQAVYRAVADIRTMWDYINSESWVAPAATNKACIALLPYVISSNSGVLGDTDRGGWITYRDYKIKWTEPTVESFSEGISHAFLISDQSKYPTKLWVKNTYEGPHGVMGTQTTNTFESVDFRLVRRLAIADVVPGEKTKFDISFRFSHPLSEKGFATVSSIRFDLKNLADITFDDLTISEDELTYSCRFTNDVAQLIAAINSDDYRTSGPAKAAITVKGTDQDGATKTYGVDSWAGCFPVVVRPNEASLSDSLWAHFKGRPVNLTDVCRVTDIRIMRREAYGLSVFIR